MRWAGGGARRGRTAGCVRGAGLQIHMHGDCRCARSARMLDSPIGSRRHYRSKPTDFCNMLPSLTGEWCVNAQFQRRLVAVVHEGRQTSSSSRSTVNYPTKLHPHRPRRTTPSTSRWGGGPGGPVLAPLTRCGAPLKLAPKALCQLGVVVSRTVPSL